jgi:hypothetical protein
MQVDKTLTNSKFIKAVIFAFFVGLISSGLARSEDLERKFSTVLTYEANNNILKFRPFDYTFSTKTQRIDLLIGKRFSGNRTSLTAYGYWKWDNKDRSWIGTRLDFGLKTLKDKLSTTLELRFFSGLNNKSKSHLYAIPTVYYKMDAKGHIWAGISGYGKKTPGQDPFFYVGLDTIIKLTDHISTLISISRDAYGSGNFLWWIVYYYF